jgi:hypothetical protein
VGKRSGKPSNLSTTAYILTEINTTGSSTFARSFELNLIVVRNGCSMYLQLKYDRINIISNEPILITQLVRQKYLRKANIGQYRYIEYEIVPIRTIILFFRTVLI